jgi:hypothetical protein
MSTRSTISYDDEFHLYQECFENDNVYLRLDGSGWTASLDTSGLDWRDGHARPSVALKIDVTLWRKIVEGWISSQWAQDTSRDHKKDEIDLESIQAWADKMNKIRRSEETKDGKV